MTDYSCLDTPECLLPWLRVRCGFDVQLISCALGQPRACVCVHMGIGEGSEMWENEGSFSIHSFPPSQEVRLLDCCVFLQ